MTATKYKEWPFKEAQRLLGRLEREGRQDAVLETGYGPSGLPHIGTFGEVTRTSFVIEAARIIAPEIKTHLIAFSDDMDGLRSVPENLPNPEMLAENLGRPLSRIPDPFGECESFAANMNGRLRSFLNSFGFTFEFMSATDAYQSGRFNEGLARIMDKHREVIDIFTPTISQEKRAAWSPFFPICENCGRMYTAVVTEHDVPARQVAYVCRDTEATRAAPCGHQGKVSIFDGKVKVGWKVDWALRWLMLRIDYEMHGKDLIDSVAVSNKVVRAIGGRAPLTYKYELFSDEEGRKISKKLGNGVSVEEWLRYAPEDVLLHFMYVKPNQPKKMALALIPHAVDQYREQLVRYEGQDDSPIRLIKVRQVAAGELDVPSSDLDYGLILNLVSSMNATDSALVMEYLERYDPRVRETEDFFRELVDKAITYNTEVVLPGRKELAIDHSFDPHLAAFRDGLAKVAAEGTPQPEQIQTLCFDIARAGDLKVRDWFKYLYQVLLSQERGPRIGSFACLYGLAATIARIDAYLAEQER